MQDTIVLYPSPGVGHIISMVELGKLITDHYKQQFSVTILVIKSEVWYNPSIPSYIQKITESHPLISFLHLPHVPFDTAAPTGSCAAMCFNCIRLHAPVVRKALVEISQASKISALVIDIFCTSALPVGKELGIPSYYYFTSGAACLASFLCFPRMHHQYDKSFKDLKSTTLHFPCVPPLRAIQVPEIALDRDDPSYSDFIYFCSNLPKSDGIVVNTFDALEPNAVRILADGVCLGEKVTTPPVYCIGPVIAPGSEEDHHGGCVRWLDGQPERSVVVLCFGSRGSFSREQVKEIASGMERSGQRFLWVVKNVPAVAGSNQTENTSDFDLESVLPEGYLARIHDKGMVVKSWIPQLAVLRHGAVGGFVTHCGWNSVLEAVDAGVPMVAWPLHAEQHLNRNLLVEVMGIAVAVENRDEDGFVREEELEARVRELMEGSGQGKEVRERIMKFKERSLDAWKSGSGTSARAFARLVDTWKREGGPLSM